MARTPSYRSSHWRKGKLPQFERWIPKPLQPLLGGRNKVREPLGDTPDREVPAALRECGTRVDKLFSTLERLPLERKAAILAAGGLDKLKGRIAELEKHVAAHVPDARLLSPVPPGMSFHEVARFSDAGDLRPSPTPDALWGQPAAEASRRGAVDAAPRHLHGRAHQ